MVVFRALDEQNYPLILFDSFSSDEDEQNLGHDW
jgi:hypothetical protein